MNLLKGILDLFYYFFQGRFEKYPDSSKKGNMSHYKSQYLKTYLELLS